MRTARLDRAEDAVDRGLTQGHRHGERLFVVQAQRWYLGATAEPVSAQGLGLDWMP
jgi:hypothetical protein